MYIHTYIHTHIYREPAQYDEYPQEAAPEMNRSSTQPGFCLARYWAGMGEGIVGIRPDCPFIGIYWDIYMGYIWDILAKWMLNAKSLTVSPIMNNIRKPGGMYRIYSITLGFIQGWNPPVIRGTGSIRTLNKHRDLQLTLSLSEVPGD